MLKTEGTEDSAADDRHGIGQRWKQQVTRNLWLAKSTKAQACRTIGRTGSVWEISEDCKSNVAEHMSETLSTTHRRECRAYVDAFRNEVEPSGARLRSARTAGRSITYFVKQVVVTIQKSLGPAQIWATAVEFRRCRFGVARFAAGLAPGGRSAVPAIVASSVEMRAFLTMRRWPGLSKKGKARQHEISVGFAPTMRSLRLTGGSGSKPPAMRDVSAPTAQA